MLEGYRFDPRFAGAINTLFLFLRVLHHYVVKRKRHVVVLNTPVY